mgnify:CR=1 FL=1
MSANASLTNGVIAITIYIYKYIYPCAYIYIYIYIYIYFYIYVLGCRLGTTSSIWNGGNCTDYLIQCNDKDSIRHVIVAEFCEAVR